MVRGPGPSKMEQIHIQNMAEAWPIFSPDRAIMIMNKKIRNHAKSALLLFEVAIRPATGPRQQSYPSGSAGT